MTLIRPIENENWKSLNMNRRGSESSNVRSLEKYMEQTGLSGQREKSWGEDIVKFIKTQIRLDTLRG